MSSASVSGIAARFPKLISYVKKLTLSVDSEDFQDSLENIKRVGHEGFGFEYELDDEDTFTYTTYDLGEDLWTVYITYRSEAMRMALTGKTGWEMAWRRALSYGYWALVVQMDARREKIVRNAASGDANWGAPALEWFGNVAGDCLALGWNDYASDLAARSRWMLGMRGFPDGGEGFQRATQWFVLALAERTDDTPAGSPGIPLFDGLLSSWRSATPADLAPILSAACDRHTHQCKSTDTDMEFDLPFDAFWYDPFEILAVLQKRAALGLENPVLVHPLMNTPLGRLQAPSAPVLDAALAAAVARARSV